MNPAFYKHILSQRTTGMQLLPPSLICPDFDQPAEKLGRS